MTSEKQIDANRANAKKSTGPRTEEGRARSRANAWKHGLTASLLVIGGEEPDDFDEVRTAFMEKYDPQSPLECELVERVAAICWRLRRVPVFEAAIIDARQAQLDHDARRANFGMPYRTPQEFDAEEMPDVEWSVYLGASLIQDSTYGDVLGKLSRYDAALVKSLEKTLLLLQENRSTKREPVMLEAVALAAAA